MKNIAAPAHAKRTVWCAVAVGRGRKQVRREVRETQRLNPPPTPTHTFSAWCISVVDFLWNSNGKSRWKENNNFGIRVLRLRGLRKRPAIYVLVLRKYYMSSTFTELFGITSTGWVYYFRNHVLFMERHDLLPDTPLFLSGIFFSLSPLFPFTSLLLPPLSCLFPLSFCEISTACPCWTITRQRDPNGDVCRKQHVYN